MGPVENITNQGTPLPGGGLVVKDHGGVLSGAIISGAFPLLFGQGPLGGAAGFGGGLIIRKRSDGRFCRRFSCYCIATNSVQQLWILSSKIRSGI